MSKGKGWDTKMVVAKESDYGTAVAGTDVLPFLSEAIEYGRERNEDQSLVGDPGFNRSFVGESSHIGPVKFNLGYGDIDLLIAAAMGTAGSPSAQTDLYYNTYELSDEVDISFTLAANKQVAVHEWTGCKVSKLTITGKPTSPLEIEAEIVAKSRAISGTTNTAETIAALALMDCPVVMFEDLAIWLGDNTDALTVSDVIYIGGFTLTIDNTLRTDELTNDGCAEPERNGRRRVSLKLDFPAYDTDNYFTWLTGDTDLQCQMLFERNDAAYTDNYRFVIRIGKMLCASYPTPIEGEQMIAPSVEFRCLRAQAESTSWAAMTEELEIDVINQHQASPIA